MAIYTHDTVPTQFVEAQGMRFAHRRFGKTGRRADGDEYSFAWHLAMGRSTRIPVCS